MISFNKRVLLNSISAGVVVVFFLISFIIPQFFLGNGIYSFPASYSYLSQVKQYSANTIFTRFTFFLYNGNYSLYDLIMSFFVGNDVYVRLSTSIFLTISMILIYFISREINNNDESSLISLIIAALIPSMWFYSVNSSLPSSFISMLYLAAMLFFIRFVNPKNKSRNLNLALFLVIYFALMLSSTVAFVFLASLALYLMTSPIFKNKPAQKENEIILFLLGTTVLYYIILYSSKLFLNMPNQGFSYFVNPYEKIVPGDFVSYLIFSGIIPIIFVFFSLWTRISHTEEMKTPGLFVFSNLLAFLLFFYLRYVDKNVISLLTGFSAAALFPLFFVDFNSMLRKSVFSERARPIFYSVMILSIIFLLFTAYSSYVYSDSYAPSSNVMLAVKYTQSHSYPNGSIMSSPDTGDLISWFSDKHAFIATKEYMFQKEYDRKMNITKELYRALLMNGSIDMTRVCEISHKKHIGSIFISRRELTLIGYNSTTDKKIQKINLELSEETKYNCLKNIFDSGRAMILEIVR